MSLGEKHVCPPSATLCILSYITCEYPVKLRLVVMLLLLYRYLI